MPNNFENTISQINGMKNTTIKDLSLTAALKNIKDIKESSVAKIDKVASSDTSKSDTTSFDKAKNNNSSDHNSLAKSFGNIGEVTGLGIADAFPSLKNLPSDIEKLPGKIFNKQTLTEFGSSAVMGLAMKAVLPESGIIPLAVGGYFMVNFALDGLKPIAKGWSKAWNAKNDSQVHDAANTISTGLDNFAGNTAIGLAGFSLGYKAFDLGGKMALGEDNMAKFTKAKDDFWTSNDSVVGRNLNKVSDYVSSKFKEIGRGFTKLNHTDYVNAIANASESDLSFDEKLDAIKTMVKHYAIDQQNEAFYMLGAIGKDGVPHGFEQTLDLISKGQDPSLLDGKKSISDTTNDSSPSTDTKNENPIKAVQEATDGQNLFGDLKFDKSAKRGQYDAKNFSDLAAMAKKLMLSWTGEKQVIADVTEPQIGAVSQGLYPAEALGPGYRPILPQLVDLQRQITDINDLRVVQPIMDGVSRAVNQRGAYHLDQTSQDVWSLNRFGQQIYEGLKDAMVKKGKLTPAEVEDILTMKNPSLFLVRSDGTDPINGRHGQGPYTVPGIKGVISLDTVYVPRNMSELTSLMANGIYGHELGHDQYGGICKFPEAIREEVIVNSIKNALGSDEYNKEIDVPGIGKMQQGKLIEEIFKAQANENTADMWGAAWTGKNAGFSLGILLQALRDSGKLESRTVYGQPLANEENPLGIEVHAIDKLRPIMIAHAMRILGNGDSLVNSQADALEAYAKNSSKSGDYTWFELKPKAPTGSGDSAQLPANEAQGSGTSGNPTTPPPSFSINEELMNKAARAIVEAQLKTPLTSLKGRTFSDILPDLASQVHRMDDLGQSMAKAIEEGKSPDSLKFNVKDYTMNDVLGAGMDAATILVSHGMDAIEANTKLNEFSGYLRDLYHTDKPGDPSLTWQNPTITKQAIDAIKEHALGKAFIGVGNFLDVNNNGVINNTPGKLFNFLPLTAGASTSIKVDELMGQHSLKQQILNTDNSSLK